MNKDSLNSHDWKKESSLYASILTVRWHLFTINYEITSNVYFGLPKRFIS